MKTIKLKIPSRLESLESIEKALDYLKGEYDKISGGKNFPLNQVKIATFEAFSNAVKHAHLNRPELEIIIQLTLEAQKFEVQIFDCGKGFDFEKMKILSQARGALLNYTFRPASLSEIGFGIFIITSLMDQVLYIPATGGSKYNQLVMIKYLSRAPSQELNV
ncbi:MAG TPA: ATP-binding protein [Candidatus Limnocylindrales bacterium]|nr:ATP-binding protein [Candidatus Limnocylindrales bacterium]